MHEKLQQLLREISPFEAAELDRVASFFKAKQAGKNELLLPEGQVCRDFYYVQSGALRTFYRDKQGNEKTRYVMLDHQLGTTLASFIAQVPSIECIEALEESSLLVISHDDFYRLNREMLSWQKLYQVLLERAYSFQNRKIEALVTLSAKQRYEQLLAEQPRFVQRLSNKVLASYLDMREETLSRLKSG